MNNICFSLIGDMDWCKEDSYLLDTALWLGNSGSFPTERNFAPNRVAPPPAAPAAPAAPPAQICAKNLICLLTVDCYLTFQSYTTDIILGELLYQW